MYKIFIVLLLSMALTFNACGDNGAKELFETAQLEELQRSYRHAEKLYTSVINKYPRSPYAEKAKQRLSVLKNMQKE